MAAVKILAIEFRGYTVPFARRLTAAWGGSASRSGLLVLVRASTGAIGYGEIAPLNGYSPESLPEARRAATELARSVKGTSIPATFPALAEVTDRLGRSGPYPPSVLCGFEVALADLAAQQAGLPLCRWLGATCATRVPVNAVLSGPVEEIGRQIESLRQYDFGTWKLKVGGVAPEVDVARIGYTRQRLGRDAILRLDANGGWRFEQALAVLDGMDRWQVGYVEEPLLLDDVHRLADLFAATGIGFALDETVLDRVRWNELMAAEAVVAAIIKPTLVGGLSRAQALCEQVAAQEKQAVVTSMLETGVGLAACLHLSAALQPAASLSAPPPCGLATLDYLADSLITRQIPVVAGHLEVPTTPGLGVTPRRDITDG